MDWDDAYANLPYIPDADHLLTRWEADAAAYRDALSQTDKAALGISYGPSARMAYDLFLPEGPTKGLCVFVHGGYWVKFDRSMWSHFAEGMRAQGYAVAMPSYDLCPAVTIPQITAQVATAIAQAAAHTDGPIILVGHSAGGHLVARMCVPGVLPDKVADRIAHVMPISPVSDLRPLLNTAMNEDFCLDAETARAESPALQVPRNLRVTVWVGGAERPVFLDQARWLAEPWKAGHVVAAERHHLNVLAPLLDPESSMVRTLIS